VTSDSFGVVKCASHSGERMLAEAYRIGNPSKVWNIPNGISFGATLSFDS